MYSIDVYSVVYRNIGFSFHLGTPLQYADRSFSWNPVSISPRCWWSHLRVLVGIMSKSFTTFQIEIYTKTHGNSQLGSVSACVLTHFDPQGCFLQWYSRSSFGFALRKYAYVQSDGPTALEAWQPWGFYFGQRYHEPWLTTCWYHIHFGHGHCSGPFAPTKKMIYIYIFTVGKETPLPNRNCVVVCQCVNLAGFLYLLGY